MQAEHNPSSYSRHGGVSGNLDGTVGEMKSGISSDDYLNQASIWNALAVAGPPRPTSDGEAIATVLGQQPTAVGTSGAPILQNATDHESVSVSTAFPPGPTSANDPASPDVIALSSDHVFFGAHSDRLLAASRNCFCFRLPADAESRQAISGQHAPYIFMLPDNSLVLNVVLHTIYGRSCDNYTPSFAVLTAAVSALKTYAIPLAPYLARGTPLYTLILGQAPRPDLTLEAFALATENQLEDLAVAISPYVLPVEVDNIPDAIAQRIGGVYMKRICALRQRRRTIMRNLVVTPPYPHPPDRRCTPSDRQSVGRAWMLAAAQLVWDFTPDMSPHSIRAILGSLGDHASCPACKESLVNRTNEVVVKWSLLDRTI